MAADYSSNDDLRYRDESVLRELYVNEGLTLDELAERFDVDNSTIRYWMSKNGIETRHPADHLRRQPATLDTRKDGYEYWYTKIDGRNRHLYHHRLLAVAKYGFENVVGKVVHHRNGIPWDNRYSNIELKDNDSHGSLHGQKLDYSDYDKIQRNVESGVQVKVVAEDFGIDAGHASRIANGWRPLGYQGGGQC